MCRSRSQQKGAGRRQPSAPKRRIGGGEGARRRHPTGPKKKASSWGGARTSSATLGCGEGGGVSSLELRSS